MGGQTMGAKRRLTEIDGVPCIWEDAPGPLRACLVFGVGRADERLPHAGITHAVEHLTLHAWGGVSGTWNGSVDVSHTRFFIEGEPDEVAEFLAGVCHALMRPNLDRLPDELRVLQVEAARQDEGQLGADLVFRFGARGPGLLGFPQYGLRRITTDEVAAWAATRFTRASAALCLTGPPPAGLRLSLGEGPAPPPPPLEHDVAARRAWAGLATKVVSVTVVGQPQVGRSAALEAAQERALRVLRHERALCYTVSAVRVELPDGSRVEGLYGDFAQDHEAEVRDGAIEILERIADEGVTQAELDEIRRRWRQMTADPRALPSRLDFVARAITRGRQAPSEDELAERLDRLEPLGCGVALGEALPSALVIGPDTIKDPPVGFTEYPVGLDASVEGRRYRPVPERERGELIVGDKGVSWILDYDKVRTVRFAECQVVARWENGRRDLIGSNGQRVVVIPQAWWDADGLERAIDDHVLSGRLVDMGPGNPISERPARDQAMAGRSTEFLQACRDAFGETPRTFSRRERFSYLQGPTPRLLKPRDDLHQYFNGRKRLLQEGAVVWGGVVQTSTRLFQPGSSDQPGEVVYCLEPGRDVDPAELTIVAERLFELKGTTPDEDDLASLAKHLAGRERGFGLPVPESVSPEIPCAISTVLFHRMHLPSGILKRAIVPLLVSQQDLRLAMVLPSKYWSAGLAEWWNQLDESGPNDSRRS
jgi:zinc protease